MQRHKLLKSLFIGLSALSLFAFAAITQAVNKESSSFKDVPDIHPHSEAIEFLKTANMIQGYETGKYLPEYTINRAEFLKIVVGAIEPNPSGSNCFKDVKDEWFAKYICTAKAKGIISGYADGTFKPSLNINIAEASKILTKAFSVQTKIDPKVWYKGYIEALEAKKAIPSSIDYLDKKVTRGEMAEIVWRLKANIADKPTKTFTALSSDVPKINSCGELQEKFAALQYKESQVMRAYEEALPTKAMEEEQAVPMAEAELGAGEALTSDYSTTNIQVEGVDEADVVKNDASYIYLVKGKTVRIIKMFPPSGMKEVSKLEIENENFYPFELFVDKNTMVVIGSTYGEKSRTVAYIFDIQDRANIVQKRVVKIEGTYLSSRKIENQLYLVTNEYPSYYWDFRILETDVEKLLPTYFDSRTGTESPLVGCGDIRFFPRYEELNYLIVAGIDLANDQQDISKEVYLGSGQIIYSSRKNLYVISAQYEYNEFIPYSIWEPPITREFTNVYQFALDEGKVQFKSHGTVPGHLLNQFSMDEYGDAFRLATTKGEVWSSTQPSSNNIYVLDKNDLAHVLGRIEDIAKGETIYSTRFIGNRLYMVTFKKIDPFFVIDLSDPKNPQILGKLKIPGYSDYLHPFDENHLIGFGKNAVTPQEIERGEDPGFAWYQGMKIGLFDVTDPSNPKELFHADIGDRGTDSEVLHNHKALLYDKKRNLFAFPVTVAEIKDKTNPEQYTGSEYGDFVFQGAYIYTLDLQNGFQLKGKVTHYDDQEVFKKAGYYWYDDELSIKRIVYSGDYLYTVSMGMIKSLFRDTVKEVGTVKLAPGEEPINPPLY